MGKIDWRGNYKRDEGGTRSNKTSYLIRNINKLIDGAEYWSFIVEVKF